MAEITIVDDSNSGIPAVVFQGGQPVSSANIEGIVQLSNGKYVAKAIGYSDTPFEVKGDMFVRMSPVAVSATEKPIEIQSKKTVWKKWVKLGVMGLILYGVVKFFSAKN